MGTKQAFRESCVLGGLASSICRVTQERPNIIVFLVDDMRPMDTSVPFIVDENGQPVRHPLNDWYHTPNMERPVKQGICFFIFYTQSVSSPFRASIMTGQNTTRHGVTNRISAESNNRNPFGPPQWNRKGLREDTLTMPRALQQAGYKTIHVGKAHFGCMGNGGEDPLNIDFDISIADSGIRHPDNYCGEWEYGHIKGQKIRVALDLEKYHGTDTLLSGALAIEANREITKAVEEKRPFYLNMVHYTVHSPFQTDKRFSLRYTSPDKDEQARAFAILIEGMDKSLSDIMDQPEKLGITENTLILFSGDNGGDAPLGDECSHGSSASLRGKKGTEFEGGMRVPSVVAWAEPKKEGKAQRNLSIEIGSMQTQLGTIMDIYPTILSVVRCKVPQNYVIDGSDLKKQPSDEADEKRPESFLMHFLHVHRGSYFTTYRMGDWKLIYYYLPETSKRPKALFYNLKDNPEERNKLSAVHPGQRREMIREVFTRPEEEGALHPMDKQGSELKPFVYF